jgi:hypothetical protein
MWNHARCIFSKKNQIKSVDDVEGIDALRWDDQEKIRNYVGSASVATSSTAAAPDKCTIEIAPSARTSCRRCSEKIAKGSVRLSAKLESQVSKGIPWYHANCFFEVSPSATVEKFSGWDTLSDEDKRTRVDVSHLWPVVPVKEDRRAWWRYAVQTGLPSEEATHPEPQLDEEEQLTKEEWQAINKLLSY